MVETLSASALAARACVLCWGQLATSPAPQRASAAGSGLLGKFDFQIKSSNVQCKGVPNAPIFWLHLATS